MIQLKSILIAALCVCLPLHGAIAVVANTGAASTDSNGVTTSAINTTGASLIVLCESRFVALATPTDSKSNTWTKLNTVSATAVTAIYYTVPTSVGSGHTFSIPTSAGTYPALTVLALSGTKATSPFDQQTTGNTNGAATSIQPGSVTPSESNELILSCLALAGNVTNLAINSSFAISNDVPFGSSLNFGSTMAYLIQGAAAAVNPTWSWTTLTNVAASIATFKSAPSSTIRHTVITQ